MRSNGGCKFKDTSERGKFKSGAKGAYDQRFGDIFGNRKLNRNIKSLIIKNTSKLTKSLNRQKTLQLGDSSPERKSTQTTDIKKKLAVKERIKLSKSGNGKEFQDPD